MTLSTEIAAARPEEQREVLVRLWGHINPRPTSPSDIEDHEKRAWQFLAMLDCGAFLSAAEMLVPEGWIAKVEWVNPYSLQSPWATVYYSTLKAFSAEAKTPALALAAAIAKSLEGKESKEHQNG